MIGFTDACSYGLRHLLHFRGRDPRAQFWFYLLGLFLAQQVLTALAIIPFVLSVFSHFPDAAARDATPGPTPAPPIFAWVSTVAVVITLLGLFLLAAAVVRRLHDSGRAGWWGLMPVPFVLFGLAGFGRLFGSVGDGPGGMPDPQLFQLMFINNAVYLVTIVALVVLLAQGSQAGPNRFGEPPSA